MIPQPRPLATDRANGFGGLRTPSSTRAGRARFQGAQIDLGALVDPTRFIGRAPQQVHAFVRDVVEPIRQRYRRQLGQPVELKV